MTAREMFRKLGFECLAYGSFIRYRKINVYGKQVIYFLSDIKQIEIECTDPKGYLLPFTMTPSLYKAINQQVKELGWLDEEEA